MALIHKIKLTADKCNLRRMPGKGNLDTGDTQGHLTLTDMDGPKPVRDS
jgi:hypothetical protein